MSWRTALLVATVALVTVTFLLLREKAVPASGASAALPSPAGPARAAAPPRPGSNSGTTAAAHAPPDTPPRATDEEHEARQRERAAEYLRDYEDPARRAVLRERELDAQRRSSAGLAERLNLPPEQCERLAELLADDAIAKRVSAARCILRAGCDTAALDSSLFGARDQDIRDIVGDAGLRELRYVRHADAERATVHGMQARLGPALALSAAQADDLASALLDTAQERRRESQLRQEHLRVYAVPEGVSLLYADNLPSEASMMRSGEEYVQAMRDRAATQLNGRQLAAFNGMCDDLLVSFRDFSRKAFEATVGEGDRTP